MTNLIVGADGKILNLKMPTAPDPLLNSDDKILLNKIQKGEYCLALVFSHVGKPGTEKEGTHQYYIEGAGLRNKIKSNPLSPKQIAFLEITTFQLNKLKLSSFIH